MIEEVKEKVAELLNKDNSSHGMDHINRVLTIALTFAKQESANAEITALIALLHDVDDYKLFGIESSKNLTNAKKIMAEAKINKETQENVLNAISTIGYSKAIQGIRPTTIEGKIVSDADMCDALGVIGIIRTNNYGIKIGRPFFNKEVFPKKNIEYNDYIKMEDVSTINILFEKNLRLKNLMLTNSGKKEAEKRHQFIIQFLYQYFNEIDAPEWTRYLNEYLEEITF